MRRQLVVAFGLAVLAVSAVLGALSSPKPSLAQFTKTQTVELFRRPQTLLSTGGSNNFLALRVADFDLDGDQDLVVYSDRYEYYRNDSGNFVKQTEFGTAGRISDGYETTLFNDDAYLDIVGLVGWKIDPITQNFTSRLEVYLGDGRGNFTLSMSEEIRSYGHELAIADLGSEKAVVVISGSDSEAIDPELGYFIHVISKSGIRKKYPVNWAPGSGSISRLQCFGSECLVIWNQESNRGAEDFRVYSFDYLGNLITEAGFNLPGYIDRDAWDDKDNFELLEMDLGDVENDGKWEAYLAYPEQKSVVVSRLDYQGGIITPGWKLPIRERDYSYTGVIYLTEVEFRPAVVVFREGYIDPYIRKVSVDVCWLDSLECVTQDIGEMRVTSLFPDSSQMVDVTGDGCSDLLISGPYGIDLVVQACLRPEPTPDPEISWYWKAAVPILLKDSVIPSFSK